MRVNAVIQARMGSTRLPGKVLEPLGSRSVLAWVVRAAREASEVDEVVVATTTSVEDDAVALEAQRLGAVVVRGSEQDVLSRFLLAVKSFSCDAVVRLTSDCPMLDPAVIDAVVGVWRADPMCDYVSSVLVRTLPHGMDVELASVAALHRADAIAVDHHRVHVTSAIYTAPSAFDVRGLLYAPDAHDLRITVDTPEDLAAIRALVRLRGEATADRREVIHVLRTHPEVTALNAAVRQKTLEDG